MDLPRYYLDHAATTPMATEVANAIYDCITGPVGNPASSSHGFGWQAQEQVRHAQEQCAALIGARANDLVFTSGATESNNLALKGSLKSGQHLITVVTEHKSVLDTAEALERDGVEITRLPVQQSGLIDIDTLKAAFRPNTALVSVMHVNNELGVIQDIQAIGQLCHEHGALFHVDAAQSAGKVPIDLSTLPVDMMSFSAHKLYGPQGIGALYVQRRHRRALTAQIHGGGHQQGLRSGTLPVHQIVGMGKAFTLAAERFEDDRSRLVDFRSLLKCALDPIEGLHYNAHDAHCVPGILSVSIEGIDGEALALRLKDIAFSSGSACNSHSTSPSYVLKAIGHSDALAYGTLRLSFGRHTPLSDLIYVGALIQQACHDLRQGSLSKGVCHKSDGPVIAASSDTERRHASEWQNPDVVGPNDRTELARALTKQKTSRAAFGIDKK